MKNQYNKALEEFKRLYSDGDSSDCEFFLEALPRVIDRVNKFTQQECEKLYEYLLKYLNINYDTENIEALLPLDDKEGLNKNYFFEHCMLNWNGCRYIEFFCYLMALKGRLTNESGTVNIKHE